MPIENIAQTGLPRVGAASGAAAPATTRQELPGSGQSVPQPVASGDVQQAVSRLNDYVQSLRRDLRFRVDEITDRVVVTVLNSESGEVIRQIPSEEILAVAQSLERTQGLLLNARA